MPMENLPFELDIAQARQTISALIRRTPVFRANDLEEPGEGRIYLKLESLQVTGSFKVRGATNRILRLSPEERKRGVVTCSSGNHGRAVAFVAGREGVPAAICVPDWVDPVKKEGMERAGARVLLSGDTYDEAEARAMELSEGEGRVFVQPFDDPWVVAGQGTLGLELLEEIPELHTVLVPLSGGGLAGGVAYAIKEQKPGVRIVGVSATNARVMYESLKVGKPLTMPEEETLAEALSGGIGLSNRYTLPLVRELVDEHVLVDEEGIREAMRFAANAFHLLLEGGGAVALAAVLGKKCDLGGDGDADGVGVVLSGGNVSMDRLRAVLA